MKTKRRRYRNLLIERLLEKWDGPMTLSQLSLASGLSTTTIHRYIKRMTADYPGPLPRQAHVHAWVRDESAARKPIAIYARGPGEDAVCKIKAKTDQQRLHEYRARQRKSGDWEDRKAAERARHWANKPARRDVTVAALFGNANAN
jgi:hypothetical protein